MGGPRRNFRHRFRANPELGLAGSAAKPELIDVRTVSWDWSSLICRRETAATSVEQLVARGGIGLAMKRPAALHGTKTGSSRS
jgi:hypothetical protein